MFLPAAKSLIYFLDVSMVCLPSRIEGVPFFSEVSNILAAASDAKLLNSDLLNSFCASAIVYWFWNGSLL